jgi:hypothetical protein
VIAELSNAREELETRLELERATFAAAHGEAAEHDATQAAALADRDREILRLDEENAEIVARLSQIELELSSARNAYEAEIETGRQRAKHHEDQLRETEEELEEQRSSLFDKMAELDAIRSNQQNLIRQVEALRAELSSGEKERGDLGGTVQRLEGELEQRLIEIASLEERLLEAQAAKDAIELSEQELVNRLDELRAKQERSDAFLTKAKEKILELQKKNDEAHQRHRAETEALVERERSARTELEQQLNHVESELSRRAQETAEAQQRSLELEARMTEKDAEIAELRARTIEGQRTAQTQEERLQFLLSDIEARERGSKALRAELVAKEQQASELSVELVRAQDSLRANAELSRERERRDHLLTRLVDTVRIAREILVTSGGVPQPFHAPVRPSWRSSSPRRSRWWRPAAHHARILSRSAPIARRRPAPPLVPAMKDAAPAAPEASGTPFGALMQEIQAEASAQRASASKASAPRKEFSAQIKPTRRRARATTSEMPVAARLPPPPPPPPPPKPRFHSGEITLDGLPELEEAARMIEAGLGAAPDASPHGGDPFLNVKAGLPEPQPLGADDLLNEESEVTEIIRLDDLK